MLFVTRLVWLLITASTIFTPQQCQNLAKALLDPFLDFRAANGMLEYRLCTLPADTSIAPYFLLLAYTGQGAANPLIEPRALALLEERHSYESIREKQ